MSEKIQELEEKILFHKDLYYKGEAQISDNEFDLLEEQLRVLDPENQVLKKIGSFIPGKKIKHQKKMLSLDKSYDIDKLLKWRGSEDVVSSFKIDGSSCSLVFEDGNLRIAKTRGDGIYGEDILEKVQYISSIPKAINTKLKIEVRGEIYCTEENFLKIKQEMEGQGLDVPSSQRNVVAGLLNRKENFHYSQFLSFQAFELISEEKISLETKKFELLKKYQFTTPHVSLCENDQSVEEQLVIASEFIDSGDYLIDGLVFTFNDVSMHERLGETSHHPRYKMAFKFQGEKKKTAIQSISWQVSRNGVLTPVALVEPVFLSQAKVSKVTLHNFGMVKINNLKIGDQIEIIRSGEVIPKFLRVVCASVHEFRVPDKCPSCNEKVFEEDIRLLCKNINCPARKVEEVRHFVSVIGIDDLSSKRIEMLFELNLINGIVDLYKLTEQDLLQLEKFQEKLSAKIISNIANSKDTSLTLFLSALGISGMGANKIEKLIKAGFSSLSKIREVCLEDLVSIDGFAEKSAQSFLASIKEKKSIIEGLLTLGVSPEVKLELSNSVLSNEKICITGSLSRKRSDIQKMIKNLGGEISSSITSKTTLLVCNDKSSSSSKLKKAQELNISIITEDDLYRKMEKS
jgi:DNA ligase (NAD+)